MDLAVQTQAAMWFLLVSFIIHDAEEVAAIAPWLTRFRQHPYLKFEPTLRLFHPKKSVTGQFFIAVIFLGVVIAVICYLATGADRTQAELYTFAAVVGVMLADGLKHVLVTALFRNYTPGVITAVLIEIPYATWMLHDITERKWVDWAAISRGTGIGVLAIPVVLLVAFGLGRVFAPLRREGSSFRQM